MIRKATTAATEHNNRLLATATTTPTKTAVEEVDSLMMPAASMLPVTVVVELSNAAVGAEEVAEDTDPEEVDTVSELETVVELVVDEADVASDAEDIV